MRINDPKPTAGLGSTTGSSSSKKSSASSIGRAESAHGKPSANVDRAAGSSDNVSLSSLSAHLSELSSASSASRSIQVDRLSHLYAGGRYTPSSSATSQAIVREASTSGL